MTLFFFAPRHTLADEVAQEFEELNPGLCSAVYRGIERPDPDQPGHTMCLDLELAQAAIQAGQSLEIACGVCAVSSLCGYMKQRDISTDILMLPSHMAFIHRADWLPDPTAQIFDEDFLQAGLAGFDKQHPVRITINTFSAQPGIFPKRCKSDDSDRADLSNYRNKLCAALANGEDRLRREVIEQAGLTADDCRNAMRIEWRYKGRLEFPVNTDRKDALHAFGVIADTFTSRAPLVWELIAEFLDSDFVESPCLTILRNRKAPKGEGNADYIQLHWRRKISKSYRDKPTLILDATGNVDLIHPYFPAVKEVASVTAHAPHRHTRHVTDRSFAKGMFVYPSEQATAANNVKRLHRLLEVDAAKCRGKGINGIDMLAVVQKDVETALGEHAEIPGLNIAHFNAVAGVNKWEGVAKQAIIGRTLPPPAELEHMTAVLIAKPIATISQAANNWWRFPVPIHMQDGTKKYVMAPRHPDPLVEAFRWQICEGQLLQTEGRGRAVNRDQANPLDLCICTNIPLPLPVDETATWDESMASPIDLMAARGIVGLDWPTVAAVLSDWFKNTKAVEDWFRHHPDEREKHKRLVNPENAYRYTLIGVFGVYGLISFKIEDNRRRRSVLMDLSLHPDPGVALSRLFDQVVEVVTVEAAATAPVTYLEPPFEDAKPIPPPIKPTPPWLIAVTPEPDPISTPAPGSCEADYTPSGNAEEIYRHVVAGMDDCEFIDADAGFTEAARRWLVAVPSPAPHHTTRTRRA